MTRKLRLVFVGALIGMTPLTAWSAASIDVKISIPSYSAGAEAKGKILKSMVFTPCLSQSDVENGENIFGVVEGAVEGVTIDNPFDQLLVEVKGRNSDDDDDGAFDYDLYFLLVNLGADGSAATIANAQFYSFSRWDPYTDALSPGVEVYLSETSSTVDPANIYLRAEDFGDNPAIDETILGGNIAFDTYSLPQGTWLAVAILAQSETVDLQDPKTWIKWDAEPFMLGMPWNVPDKTCERY